MIKEVLKNNSLEELLSKNDFDISSSVRSIKVDETNNYDENKKKDDIDNLKMSDFTLNTEKKSINT